jgi:hypothetical protein
MADDRWRWYILYSDLPADIRLGHAFALAKQRHPEEDSFLFSFPMAFYRLLLMLAYFIDG